MINYVKNHYNLLALLFLMLVMACKTDRKDQETVEDDAAPEISTSTIKLYQANVTALNPSLYDEPVSGLFSINIIGNTVTFKLDASNLPPNMMHLMHLHGFENGDNANCPSMEADANNDGIIDLIETRDFSGITMIPMNENPSDLDILEQTYPSADSEGNVTLETMVNLNELGQAVQDNYGLSVLEFDDMVFYIHSVPENTSLPNTVESLPDVPARVTVPIACGEVNLVE
jgi:hypothetical protein